MEKEVLIVVSKVKNYIKESSDLKCSNDVLEALSDNIRTLIDEAVVIAKADHRKTLKGRDFQ